MGLIPKKSDAEILWLWVVVGFCLFFFIGVPWDLDITFVFSRNSSKYQFKVPKSESHAMKSFFHWELQQELLHNNVRARN